MSERRGKAAKTFGTRFIQISGLECLDPRDSRGARLAELIQQLRFASEESRIIFRAVLLAEFLVEFIG
jgi:hypothetical protein